MEERVTHHMRELYNSANGDHWYLVRDDESEEVFVTHRLVDRNTPTRND